MWLVIAMVDTDLEALLLLNVQLTRNKTCFKKSKVKQMSESFKTICKHIKPIFVVLL